MRADWGPEREGGAARTTFRTTAADLVVLRDGLAAHGVTHVAMESTGVYRKPVFYALESDFTCLLVNATHIKQVPGRKTDIQDYVWIAQLLDHGLLRAAKTTRQNPSAWPTEPRAVMSAATTARSAS